MKILIFGLPGSGKSTLTAALVDMVNEKCRAEGAAKDVCICLPMDGFHYSRAELRSIAERNPSITFESDLSRTMNSMSKRDKRESGRLMLRVIPWL